LCIAGLPHGSASGNSRETLRIVRGFWVDVGVGAGADIGTGGGVVGRWAGFAASPSTPGNVDADVLKLASLGFGRSTTLSVQCQRFRYGCRAPTFSSLINTI
jgi:hypothetical protein